MMQDENGSVRAAAVTAFGKLDTSVQEQHVESLLALMQNDCTLQAADESAMQQPVWKSEVGTSELHARAAKSKQQRDGWVATGDASTVPLQS